MPIEALARIPDSLTPEEAAPLMCAGITTFNALRNSGAGPATLSQYRVSAVSAIWVSSSRANSALRRSPLAEGEKNGNSHWNWEPERTSTRSQNVAKELTALGGARVILATAPDGKAMGELIDGLGVDGKLVTSRRQF